jgi:hypothetical protein
MSPLITLPYYPTKIAPNVLAVSIVLIVPVIHKSKNHPKSIPANIKANRANAQSRLSGILFALANGKLYFEFLKIFPVPENHLPLQGVKTLPKSAFLVKEKTPCYSEKKQIPCNSVLK